MLNETLKCPNCGTVTTNRTHCEHCGALLVRYTIAKNLISESQNECLFPELIPELTEHLEMQRLFDDTCDVITWIGSKEIRSREPMMSFEKDCVIYIKNAKYTLWQDGTDAILPCRDTDYGLSLYLIFKQLSPSGSLSMSEKRSLNAYNNQINNHHSSFKSIPSFPSFTYHYSECQNKGYLEVNDEYGIHLGSDVNRAAQLATEILTSVWGIEKGDSLSIERKIMLGAAMREQLAEPFVKIKNFFKEIKLFRKKEV